MRKMMGGKESEINRAQESEPKGRVGHAAPAAGVGQERKAEVRQTQEGGSAAEAANNPLRGAVQHLHREHPHAHSDHGPHHGTTDHITHMPLHGMKPGKMK